MHSPLPETEKLVLLLVEDDKDMAVMMIEMLSDYYHVTHSVTAEEGLELSLRRSFNIMVVDRRLPGMDGVALIRALRRAHINTPVLMLTAHGTLDDRISGLDGGANDYLVKPFEFGELLARLRALLRGFKAQGRRRYIGDWTYVPDAQTIYAPEGTRVLLTATENSLLDLLSASPEQVFSRYQILDAVFSADDSQGTVDTYVHYLRKKTCRELVETIRAQGYRLGDLP